MLRLKQYLDLQEYFDLKDLDANFLSNAEKLVSFNLLTKEFESLKHKKEIQWIFKKHFFPDFDLKNTIENVDKNKLNKLITELKGMNPKEFNRLHSYNLKGVGPGEVTLYFLVNKAHLGGGSSAGVDVIDVGGKLYEIKAVNYSKGGANNQPKPHVFHFKLGGTMDFSAIVKKLIELKKQIGSTAKSSEIPTSDMKSIKEKFPTEYSKLEKEYSKIAYNNYFKHHDVIFMKNQTKGIGNIIDIKAVKMSEIKMQTYTSNSLKPLILI